MVARDATQAKKLVVVALASAGAISVARDLANGEAPRLRILLGATLAAVVLTVLADFGQPQIASGFAVLIVVAAIFAEADVWKRIARALRGS